MIERIVVTDAPEKKGHRVRIVGDIVSMLGEADAAHRGEYDAASRSLELVAGAGFGLCLQDDEANAEQMHLVAGGHNGLRLPFAAYGLRPTLPARDRSREAEKTPRRTYH